jgi:hypothetical protein
MEGSRQESRAQAMSPAAKVAEQLPEGSAGRGSMWITLVLAIILALILSASGILYLTPR